MKNHVRYRKLEAVLHMLAQSLVNVGKAKAALAELMTVGTEDYRQTGLLLEGPTAVISLVWETVQRMQTPLFPESVPLQKLWDRPEDKPPAA